MSTDPGNRPLSNPIIEQMHRHASVRSFSAEPVPREVVETIVAAGQRAATSSNMQRYSAVAVADERSRHHLAELCSDQDQIRQAPVFIAWCADLSRLERVCEARGYRLEAGYVENLLVAAVDVALVMQNAALAAESLGYGACYIGAIRQRPAEVIEALALPRLVFPISGMTLGRPAAPARPRPRLETGAILHWERYGTEGEAERLARYDRAMIASGIYQGRQVPVPGVEGAVEDYGWMEHSARRVSQPVRTGLREVIEAQGFGMK